jgi:hypothetical protein
MRSKQHGLEACASDSYSGQVAYESFRKIARAADGTTSNLGDFTNPKLMDFLHESTVRRFIFA